MRSDYFKNTAQGNCCGNIYFTIIWLFTMETVGEALKTLFSVWAEMIGAFFSVLPKLIKFVLWVASALIILPCVFVAGSIYPAWAKWGEDF